MRLTIAAVGRLKEGGERVLADRYLERLASARGLGLSPVVEKEIAEARRGTAAERRNEEAGRLFKAVQGADAIVLLDERGRQMPSDVFAGWIGARRDAGTRHLAFLIGGADGHGEGLAGQALMTLSLGAMTLPHGLARVVLVEQIYRATTILAGHPYHRA